MHCSRSLVAAAADDADVGVHLSESLGVEQHLSERLRGGIRDGQLPAGAPVAQIGRAILGAIIVESLGREARDPDGVVDLVRYLPRPLSVEGASRRATRATP